MPAMSPLTKRILIVLGALLLAVVAYFAYGYHNLKVQSAAAEHVREQQPMFQAQLLQYQRTLRVGMSRSEVIRYLQLRGVSYLEDRREIHVYLGDEPDVFPCDRWAVYVSFEFGYPQIEFGRPQMNDELSPQDPLGAISLKRIGHCL